MPLSVSSSKPLRSRASMKRKQLRLRSQVHHGLAKFAPESFN